MADLLLNGDEKALERAQLSIDNATTMAMRARQLAAARRPRPRQYCAGGPMPGSVSWTAAWPLPRISRRRTRAPSQVLGGLDLLRTLIQMPTADGKLDPVLGGEGAIRPAEPVRRRSLGEQRTMEEAQRANSAAMRLAEEERNRLSREGRARSFERPHGPAVRHPGGTPQMQEASVGGALADIGMSRMEAP